MSEKRIITLGIMTTVLPWKMQHIVLLCTGTFFPKSLLPAPNVQELQFDPQNHKSVCKMINVELFYFAFCFFELLGCTWVTFASFIL